MSYYVYVYLDPRKEPFEKNGFSFEHEPFYIGKGAFDRKTFHLFEARNLSKHNHKVNKIRAIFKQGLKPKITIAFDGLTETEAFELERDLIKAIGRNNLGKGPLVNLTDGGEGVSGRILSARERELMSEALKASIKAKEFRESPTYKENLVKIAKYARSLKGKDYNERYGKKKAAKVCSKIRENHADVTGSRNPMFEKIHSAETKEKISKRLKGNPNLGGRKGKYFAVFVFYKNGIKIQECGGQKAAKEFCRNQGIPFQTLCKLKKTQKNWKCLITHEQN